MEKAFYIVLVLTFKLIKRNKIKQFSFLVTLDAFQILSNHKPILGSETP